MPPLPPSRLRRTAIILAAALCALTPLASPQMRSRAAPPTAHGGGYGPHGTSVPQQPGNLGHGPGQQHLAEWMSHHGNQSPSDQQRALEHEPGFRQLAPNVQQRMRDRLTQLNTMPQGQRQRVIERTEAMERLAPEQRQQIRSSMQQLSGLAPDRRRAVARAFREYRGMPSDQRQAALASGRFSAPLSPEERATFNNLVTVEPYLPAPPVPFRPAQPMQPPPYAPAQP